MEFDLHIHSKYSFDSFSDPREIVKVAEERGLAGVAIVDHDTIRGALEAQRIPNCGVRIIAGSEISTNVGDVIGLFLNDEIKSSDVFGAIDEIKSQGGISVLPHPMKQYQLSSRGLHRICEKIDAIEIFNSRVPVGTRFSKHLESFHKPFVAGSDAHFTCEIGLGRTVMVRDAAEDEDIKDAILKGSVHTWGSKGPTFLQNMSQIIKGIKLKKPTYSILASASMPVSLLRDIHDWSIFSAPKYAKSHS